MTTISKARKMSEQGLDYAIRGQLVSKQIFTTLKQGQVSKLLIMVIMDAEGNLFEVKTWSERKAYTVFRKFPLNSFVEVNASAEMRDPNPKYSRAVAEIYSTWFMSPAVDSFRVSNGVKCFSSIAKYQQSQRKPANIVGTFYKISENGPFRKSSQGYILVQGHYLQLLDEAGEMFKVLVWVAHGQKCSNKDILEAQQGDLVLILAAREQDDIYKPKNAKNCTLTTTYPALVNPACIAPHTRDKLGKSRRHETVAYALGVYCTPTV